MKAYTLGLALPCFFSQTFCALEATENRHGDVKSAKPLFATYVVAAT